MSSKTFDMEKLLNYLNDCIYEEEKQAVKEIAKVESYLKGYRDAKKNTQNILQASNYQVIEKDVKKHV